MPFVGALIQITLSKSVSSWVGARIRTGDGSVQSGVVVKARLASITIMHKSCSVKLNMKHRKNETNVKCDGKRYICMYVRYISTQVGSFLPLPPALPSSFFPSYSQSHSVSR